MNCRFSRPSTAYFSACRTAPLPTRALQNLQNHRCRHRRKREGITHKAEASQEKVSRGQNSCGRDHIQLMRTRWIQNEVCLPQMLRQSLQLTGPGCAQSVWSESAEEVCVWHERRRTNVTVRHEQKCRHECESLKWLTAQLSSARIRIRREVGEGEELWILKD